MAENDIVPSNAPIVSQRGKRVINSVTVSIGNSFFTGWKSISITKNLESIANSFSIILDDTFEGLRTAWPLRPGVSVKINIDKERVLTGRIEKVGVRYTKENRGFTISGRSNPGDLVDCMHTGPCEYNNIFLDKLAEELIAPFGLKVFLSVVPEIINKFAIKPGETIFAALDRAARLQGFFWVSTRGGNIRLTRAARARAFSRLQQDVNILSATASYDDSKRHDQYIVKGQTIGLAEFFGKDASEPEGKALDAGIKRHRPMIVIAESNVDGAKAKIRAQWEASSRLAQSIRVSVTIQDWLQADNSLWGINQIVKIQSAFLGLDRDMLIASVVHNKSVNGGTTSTMDLVDSQSYTLQDIVNENPKDDIFASLGANF